MHKKHSQHSQTSQSFALRCNWEQLHEMPAPERKARVAVPGLLFSLCSTCARTVSLHTCLVPKGAVSLIPGFCMNFFTGVK